MMNRNGFTLIEMLVTLSVFSILLVLIVPHQSHSLNQQVEDRFIEQLDQDVLFLQNQTALTKGQRLEIKFQDHYYQMYDDGVHPILSKRYYPTNWRIIHAYNRNIRFTEEGTLLQPRTITIHSDTERISLVFPFGKGRFYVEKEKRVFND